MKEIMFPGKINWLAYTLFFLAVFFVPSKTLFSADITEQQLEFMEEAQRQIENFEDIEDVMFGADLSDEEIQKILTEAPKPVPTEKAEAERKKQLAEQQRLAKLQETDALRAQADKDRLAKQKDEEALAKQKEQERLTLKKQRQEELARKEEELKQREAQLQADKDRLAQEAAAKKAEEEKAEAERKKQLAEQQRLEKEKEAEALKAEKEKIQLASVQKEKIEASAQKESVQQETTTKATARKKVTLKELQQKLGLTDKQVQRLTPIMKENASKRREILSKYAGKGEAAKPAFKKELLMFQNYYDNMYQHILSEEQWVKYTAMRGEEKKQIAQ